MLDLSNPSISIKRQSELAGVNRTSAYRKETISKESAANIWLMHRIDEIHTEFPTYGYRIISGILRNDGIIVNRKRIRRLMRLMGIQAIYPGPNLSKLLHSKYIKPYLLRNLGIVRPDQVWGVDITYIRMEQGFMYMFVILDWFSRYVIDYELSTTLEKGFVITCLNRALAKSRPEIINSDQGGHFTNEEYTGLLNSLGIKISMDGKGRATDNARTERFFRTMKYDCIYINEFESPKQLRTAIAKFIEQYNYQRPSQPLNYEAPAIIYYQNAIKKAA